MKKILYPLFLLLLPIVAMAQQMEKIPFNKDVRRGQLDNGLTYYILKNGYPEKRASFWIAQRVGSIQEDDDQRGLAHFLEHMAFNGSENFKSSDAVVEYCRSIGCAFGRELNAYTSTDETVYRVCNVPTDRVAVTDSVMLILKDWANGLTLDGKEIDNERGVIHEEWRLRSSASQRIFERNLPQLYPGSKYGQRMPIGKMEVIDNFSHDALRNYYKKWYRPDNQAIVIVGDIDVDRTEAKLKEVFGSIPKPSADAPQVIEEPVPDNNEMIVVVDKDKEQAQNQMLICFKSQPLPRQMREYAPAEMMGIMTNAISSMVNERLSEAAQNADCPFTVAQLSYGTFLMSKTMKCFELVVLPKDGKDVEAAQAACRILMQAFKAGFNDSELQRAKDNIIAAVEAKQTNKDKIHNDQLGPELYNHFLNGYVAMSPDTELELDRTLCNAINTTLVNQVTQQAAALDIDGKNVVLLSLNREAEGVKQPESQALKEAILAVAKENFEAYLDNTKNEPLVPVLPEKGKIISEKKNDKYGSTELTLSNGARVIMKKTDFKADEIAFYATSVGGKSLYDKTDIINFKIINDAVECSGLGNFSSTELQKALAGKKISLSFNLAKQHELLTGSSTPKDIETFMQIAYLYFTNIYKDQKSFDNIMAQYQTLLNTLSVNPDVAFSDSLTNTLHDYDPAEQRITIEDLKKVDYDRCLQIARERLANAADFTFYFVGNYDEAILRNHICQYIASLPGNPNNKETAKPVTQYHKGVKENIFTRKMETPKAVARIYWYNNSVPFTLDNQLNAQAAGEILQMIYIREIREKESAAYSASAGGNTSPTLDMPFNYIIGVCPFKPEKKDIALNIMETELQKLATTVDADMLNKVKENLLKKHQENLKTNSYWINILAAADEYKVENLTEVIPAIKALSQKSVSDFVRTVILNNGNKVKVVMLPENETK
ncbi:MAG: insulinase family protein [Bacteroidaceae bacterium]|nr:insulinase family protein [Bacteroidaceae bacterium]